MMIFRCIRGNVHKVLIIPVLLFVVLDIRIVDWTTSAVAAIADQMNNNNNNNQQKPPPQWLSLLLAPSKTPKNVSILIVGDSIARYFYLGMRARAKMFGCVVDVNTSHPPVNNQDWELYAHIATTNLRLSSNQLLRLRYERVQYLDEAYNWSSPSIASFNPTYIVVSRGAWDVWYRYNNNNPKDLLTSISSALRGVTRAFPALATAGRIAVYGIHKTHVRFPPLQCVMTKGVAMLRRVLRAASRGAKVRYLDTYTVSRDMRVSATNKRDGLHYINDALFKIVDEVVLQLQQQQRHQQHNQEEEKENDNQIIHTRPSVCPEYCATKRKDRIATLKRAISAANISFMSNNSNNNINNSNNLNVNSTLSLIQQFPGVVVVVVKNKTTIDDDSWWWHQLKRARVAAACVHLQDSLDRGWGGYFTRVLPHLDKNEVFKITRNDERILIRRCQALLDDVTENEYKDVFVPLAMHARFSPEGLLGVARARQSPYPVADEWIFSHVQRVGDMGLSQLRQRVAAAKPQPMCPVLHRQLVPTLDQAPHFFHYPIDEDDYSQGTFCDLCLRCGLSTCRGNSQAVMSRSGRSEYEHRRRNNNHTLNEYSREYSREYSHIR
eukprot:PhM_4_TR2087/c4_g1_i10/m.91453